MSKSRRNENTKWIVAFFIELIVIALMSYGVFRVYIHEKYQKLDHVNDMTEDELGLNDGANPEMDEYTNIALFGMPDSLNISRARMTRLTLLGWMLCAASGSMRQSSA